MIGLSAGSMDRVPVSMAVERAAVNKSAVSVPTAPKKTNVTGRVSDLFEKVIWPFVNQSIKVVKQVFKVVVIKCPEYAARLSKVTAHIGFLSGISLLLTFKSLPGQMANWCKNFPLEDLEGGVLGTLDLMATLGSVLDDASTLSSSLAALGAIPKIAFFGAIGMPLAFGLLAYSIGTKSYTLVRNGRFAASLPKEITVENIEEFKKFIDQRVDDADEKLKMKKIRVLSRHADPKVTAIMEKLKKHLEKNPLDVATANLALNDMKTLMNRKISLDVVATGSNVATLAALAASLIFPAAAIAVPVVAALKASTALSAHAYKTFWLDADLKSLEKMEAAAAA